MQVLDDARPAAPEPSRRPRFVGPDPRDPRLHVAAVVVSVQVLGQLVLRFDVSIAQILVALVTSAAIELAITYRRDRTIAWPASALLTGNGVALVLRVPGTAHGDWWSLRGAWIFAAVAAVSLGSKYVLRVGGRPLFNPSNLGLVLAFLVLGSGRVDPLDFWWVRFGPALAVALAVIVAGGLLLARRIGMLGTVVGFWITLAAGLGVLVARGHCITARWHVGPVCGDELWWILVSSPEVLVFMFFMITDPRTSPRGRVARVAYGVTTALVFVALAAPQRTEYATKVALLGALAIVCAVRPLAERLLPAPGTAADALGALVRRLRRPRAVALVAAGAATYAGVVVGAGAPAATAGPAAGAAPVAAATCPGDTSGARAAGTKARPRPVVEPAPLPAVRVANPVNVATTLDAATARGIVRDVLDDLAIAAAAVERGDPGVAPTVARSPWLDDLVAAICANGDTAVVPEYRVTDATVGIVKRSRGQAYPEIDVRLEGERTERTLTRAAPRRQLSARTEPYDATLVVASRGGYWLVCGDRADPRTASCITSG